MNKIVFEKYLPKFNVTLQVNDNHDNVITAIGDKPHNVMGLYAIFGYYAHHRNGCYMYNLPLYVMDGCNNNQPTTELDFWLCSMWKTICEKKGIKENKNGLITVMNYNRPKITAIGFINYCCKHGS